MGSLSISTCSVVVVACMKDSFLVSMPLVHSSKASLTSKDFLADCMRRLASVGKSVSDSHRSLFLSSSFPEDVWRCSLNISLRSHTNQRSLQLSNLNGDTFLSKTKLCACDTKPQHSRNRHYLQLHDDVSMRTPLSS